MTKLADVILNNQEAFSNGIPTTVTFKGDPFGLAITRFFTDKGNTGYAVRYKDLAYALRTMDIESLSSQSDVDGYEKIDGFKLYIESLPVSFMLYKDLALKKISEYIEDYENSSVEMQMLHEDIEGLIMSCLSIDNPTTEQVELLELAHFYYTKRNFLTDADMEVIDEKFSLSQTK